MDERTYTIGDTQYWRRSGKTYKWTEAEGRVEISEDEYMKAISGGTGESPKPTSSKEDKSKPRKVEKPENYQKAPSEDLALLAKDGDKKAEEEIISRYIPLVHKIANKYFIRGGDKDDLVQDGMIGVWDAIKGYDEIRNGDFTKYLGMAIDNRLKVSVRADNTGKNSIINQATSMDTQIDNGEGEGRTLGDTLGSKGPSIEEDYLGREGARKLMDFMKSLPSKERDVIFRFVNGSNLREIAADTGMSYKSVENALMRARNKIKEFRAMNEARKLKEGQADNIRITFRKKKEDVDESSFEYGGKVYKSKWGKYSCDGRPISKEDYHHVAKMLWMNKDDSIFQKHSNETVDRLTQLHTFIEGLEYDQSYEISRDTRNHLPRIDKDNKEDRIKSIMEDVKCDELIASQINRIFSEYTDLQKDKFTDEETELLNLYLSNAPVYNSIPLYRGIGFMEAIQDQMEAYDIFKNLKVGDPVVFRGITSVTSNPDVAINFADANGEKFVYMIFTKNLSAVSIDHLTSIDVAEEECLYKQDAPMVVKKIEEIGNSVYVQIEERDLSEDISIGEYTVLPINGTLHLKQYKE